MKRSKEGLFDVEYLSQEVLLGFQSYKYNSVDTSPLSNYVMHPFWNWTVEKFCPLWIAPNVLTFTGFLACVLHFLVLSFYDPNFTSPNSIPPGAWLAASVLLFLSHTLDGIDGKQARRTKTSGPLGELFDHGLDSWSTMFITVSLYAVFGQDPTRSISVFRMYLALWAVFLNFQFSHFEKYNTGIMYLPWAYDVSMVGGCLLYLLTAFVSPDFYYESMPFPPGPTMEAMLYLGSLGLTVPAGLFNIYNAFRHGTGNNRPLPQALSPLSSFASALFVCLAWATLSPAALENHPRAFYYMSGVLYSNIACRLIVSQMSNTSVELVNALLLPTGLSAVLVTFLPPSATLPILYALGSLLTLAHAHYGICVVRQLTRHFGISCFTIQSAAASSPPKDEERLLSNDSNEDDVSIDDIV